MSTQTQTRGRKKADKTELPAVELDGDALAELGQTEAAIAQIQAGYSEERDLVNQLLGQAQMADAFGQFSQTVWATKLAYVKEHKLYKGLAGQKTPNGLAFSGTWEEFCKLLGVSDEKANQDIANLRTFGEAALESMSRMGIGYRELRQYRRLPDDSQQALVEVAESGDKEALLDLAEELIAKQKAEKDALAKQLDEAKADVTAKDAVIADKSTRIDQLETTVQRIKTLPPDEQSEHIRTEASHVCFEVEALIRGQLGLALETALEHATDHGLDITAWLGGELDQIDDALLAVRDRLAMPREVRQ